MVKKIKKLPDVVVCSNDLIAYGVIESFKERKIKVPQDVSVTGYDDITFSKMFSPALTTVRQPIYEMGENLSRNHTQAIDKKKMIIYL